MNAHIRDAVSLLDGGIRHIHVDDLLKQLEGGFNYHFEELFVDGDVVHLHKAEVIKEIADWVVTQCDTDDKLVHNDGSVYYVDNWDFVDDIRMMKEYLVVAGHLDSPVIPKPRKRDSNGEVSL